MANINDRINGQEFESASPLAHAVRYDRAQVKTEEQKKQARENIGCYCEAGGGGGGSSGGGAFVVNVSYSDSEDTFTMDKTAKEIWEAAQSSTILVKVPADEGVQDVIVMVDAKKDSNTSSYMFVVASMRFMADGDDVYPHVGGGGGGGGAD